MHAAILAASVARLYARLVAPARVFFHQTKAQNIMAKVTLGKRPTHFKKTVSFDMLDGTVGSIECTYVYRTKTEFGTFITDLIGGAEKVDPAAEITMASVMARTVEQNAEYLQQVLTGWDLDSDLTKENLAQLADELPGAVAAIMDGYRAAVVEGRLGN